MEQTSITNNYVTPKHVFLHLLMIVMLYVCVIAILTLYFQYINEIFFDPAFSNRSSIYNGIRWASAALMVGYPVLVLTSWFIHKALQHDPALYQMKTRRWLLFFTQFITALTIIIDLMVLIYEFYGGEITSRFIFKTLTVLIVAGAVLGYYRWELHHAEGRSFVPKIAAISGTIILVVSLVAGFFIAGSPAQQRAVRLDEQRVNDLIQMQDTILSFTQNKQHLPKDQERLEEWGGYVPVDPETQQPYIYERLTNAEFRLCTTFGTEATEENLYRYDSTPYGVKGSVQIIGDNRWLHPAGKYCFERTVDLTETIIE